MSFGNAASRRARTVEATAACPCGSTATFGGCCGPLLRGAPAPTAERLMRSRYTAFVLGDDDHLSGSWHARTRPDAVDSASGPHWTGLEILDTEGGGVEDAGGVVEFRARWTDRGTRGELHERSRFVRQAGRWWYVAGDVLG
ncbi:YchJ family metal-binding protein [Microbacterium sp. zg.B48]|uniref:YchJ family protein n=1 Tax=Microbacterium sp. zg.B48 TaxID=2969408 RepID=UPI00214C2E4C|nr:YchJ family metal-binding protein [Microbacterium sp. zg.B48]MCR2763478.1 YchJ family metal-binding protein [Microbacterium sp. zg.B48]